MTVLNKLEPIEREKVLIKMKTLRSESLWLRFASTNEVAIRALDRIRREKKFSDKAYELLRKRTVTIILPGREKEITTEEFKQLREKEMFLVCPSMNKFVLVSKSWFNWWSPNFKLSDGTIISCSPAWDRVINPIDYSQKFQAIKGIDYEKLGFKGVVGGADL